MANSGDDVVSVWDENGNEHKVSRARSMVLRQRGYRLTPPSGKRGRKGSDDAEPSGEDE